jgi:hypothetical protein
MECHKDLTGRILSGRGLHATYVTRNAKSTECIKCHSEHNGTDFVLIRWDPSPGKFDHSKTGYVLEGKHAVLGCRRCHNPALIPASDRERLVALQTTYLGLSKTCVSCHEDKHRGQLGQDCSRCHNTMEWKISKQFDHSKTKYPLTGAHAHVDCQKCHSPISGNPQNLNYLGLKFDKCSTCHTDPHKGAFPQACESCHSTVSWKRVSIDGKFDHSKTKYPLLGKHVNVACDKCHTNADFKKPIVFSQCADCHKPDPHGGQFAKRTDGGKCESCHTVEGFKPSRFGVTEHQTSAYPLDGKHATVECTKCHKPAGKETQYKIKFAQCLDCHKDFHEGEFAGPPHNNRCEDCHTVVNGFRPSTFKLAAHKQTRFPLVGAHIAVACVDCHKSAGDSRQKPRYKFKELTCTQCHKDIHKGQFADRMAKLNSQGLPAGCEVCHSTKSWKEVSRFDHSNTKYPLTGTHRSVACIACHKPPALEINLRNVDFRKVPNQCADCHAEAHGHQFADSNKITKCESCHNTMKWRPSTFDHEKRTEFPLKGAHQNVRCVLCHVTVSQIEGKAVVFYKPTPKRCADCHGANIPAERS